MQLCQTIRSVDHEHTTTPSDGRGPSPQSQEAAYVAQLENAVSDLRRENVRLRNMASNDTNIGVANRRRFDRAVTTNVDAASLHGQALSVLIVHLEGAFRVTATQGRRVTAAMFRRAADHIRSTLTDMDLVAHLGGGTFAVLLPGQGAMRAGAIADEIRARMNALAEGDARVNALVGAASLGDSGCLTPSDLIDRAYAACLAG